MTVSGLSPGQPSDCRFSQYPRRIFLVRFILPILFSALMLGPLTGCRLFRLTEEENQKNHLQIDESFLTPLEAEWATVFLAPRWAPISRADLHFRRAWARQITAIQQQMVHIQLRGHVLYDELEQLVADLTTNYGAEAIAVRQMLIDYAQALLQADIAARAAQQDYGGSESEQAVRQYIRFLASARLTSQANKSVGSLLDWAFNQQYRLSEDEAAMIADLCLPVLDAHANLLDSSRIMIESYARLKLTDEILGSLLDGVILAKSEQLSEKFSQLAQTNAQAGESALAVTKQLELLSYSQISQSSSLAYLQAQTDPTAEETALAVTRQLDLLTDRMSNQPEPDVYYSRAKSLSNLFSIAEQTVFTPIDYLGEAIARVLRPVTNLVNHEIELLGQTLDDASGQRISALYHFMDEQLETFIDTASTYLDLSPDHSAQALQQATQTAADNGLSTDGLDAMQQISLEQRDNLTAPGQEKDLTALLEAGGYTTLAQLTGYLRTLADGSLEWLDEGMSAMETFLALPDQQTIDETQRQLEQMLALQGDDQQSESELQYLSDLLGVDLESWLHWIEQTETAWVEKFHDLGDRLDAFIGPDGVQIRQSIRDVMLSPFRAIDYPLQRLFAASDSISRYTMVQSNRMTLQILLTVEEIEQQLAEAGQDLSHWQDLPEEIYTYLHDHFSLEQAVATTTEIYQHAMDDTWHEWLESWVDSGQSHPLAEWISQMTLWIHRLDLSLPQVTESVPPTDEPTFEPTSEPTDEPIETSDQDIEDTSEDSVATEPTSEPDLSEDIIENVWSGQWSGQMLVKEVHFPDEYTDEEIDQILTTPIPISFVIGQYEDGSLYIIDIEGEIYDLNVKQQEMDVVFKAILPDLSDTLYQAISGSMAADEQTISGNFRYGIEGIGDYLSGTWSADRTP